jgi:hypothetical protein
VQKPSTTTTSPNRESVGVRAGRCDTVDSSSETARVKLRSRRGGASHGGESSAPVAKDDLPVLASGCRRLTRRSAAWGLAGSLLG